MKNALRLASLVSLLLAGPLAAQTFLGTDNFNDNTLTTGNPQAVGKWRGVQPGTGAWNETNQRMEFTVGSTTGTSNTAALTWISPTVSDTTVGGAGLPSGAPYTSSWIAQVEVTHSLASLSSGYIVAGIEVYSLTSTYGSNGYYGIYLNNSSGTGSRVMSEWGIYNAGISNFDRTSTFAATSDVTDVILRLSFDAPTKVLTTSYSFDAINFTTGATFSIAGAQAGLQAPFENLLGINLSVFSNNSDAVTAGTVYFDNISVSAVPEPSAFAMFAGLAVLGLATTRRRSRSAGAVLPN